MTRDLEDTLKELGPEYRPVVNRLRAPFADSRVQRRPCRNRVVPYLLAASLLLVLSFAVWSVTSGSGDSEFLASGSSRAPAVYTVAYASDEFALRAIIDSQRSDGSWSNDYLTMQNAAALRRAHDEASQIAYKRAVRYLRTKGLGPISEDELKRRSVLAPSTAG